jgi:hypothetical protein
MGELSGVTSTCRSMRGKFWRNGVLPHQGLTGTLFFGVVVVGAGVYYIVVKFS